MLKVGDLEKLMQKIIEDKYRELGYDKNIDEKFSKIRPFEGNAIGQIGDEFAKAIIKDFTEIVEEGVIHDEYDIKTKKGVLVEVKTARKGKKNNTFQFNGINPKYNYKFLLCLGITENSLHFRIFPKENISYVHKEKRFYMKQGDFSKQLVKMNPDNQVNYKLTLSLKELFDISLLCEQLESILS